MERYMVDALNCLNIINGNISACSEYNHLYKHTNEDLNSILSSYDLKGKNILSVLASSEQVFSCYYLGANDVDTFDVNILTYYYFYLRKWMIMNGIQNDNITNIELLNVIESHDNTEEEIKAYNFWKYVLSKSDKKIFTSPLFHMCFKRGYTPYDNNPKGLKKIISSKKPRYMYLDLFKPLPYAIKKYQVIILSNILEYVYDDDKTDELSNIVSKNINNLLESGGIAISTNLRSLYDNVNPLFDRFFEYVEGPYKDGEPLCYAYKKL